MSDVPPSPPAPDPAPDPAHDPAHDLAPDLAPDAEWRRLDLRMLLVHPVNEVIRFLPIIVGIFLFGSDGGDGGPWHYLGVAIPVLIGVVRFASTKFRITPGQIELHRGVLGRNVLTAPLDRVRTVELTATLIHRLLGLEKVEIGTGSAATDGDSRLVLDSLGSDEARRLRTALLHRAPVAEAGPVDPTGTPAEGTVILRFDPRWVRYAPLTSGGLVLALAALGAIGGPLSGSSLISDVADSGTVEDVTEIALPLLILGGLVGFAVLSAVLAALGYLLANWGFTLSRDDRARTFHVRRGALTTRETSIDLERLRGIEVHEPLGLRTAGASRLNAIVTGLNRRSEERSPLVPAAPAEVVDAVGEVVLGESGPLHAPLRRHGPAAQRRRYVRAIVPLALVPLGLLVLALFGSLPLWAALLWVWLPLAGIPLARDRYARLGHTLTPAYVVMRWGCFRGRRDALQRSGVIGWNISQTWFQRRAGLVSLTATTAAGRQSYEILDLPEATAIALADEAVPGLVSQFLAR